MPFASPRRVIELCGIVGPRIHRVESVVGVGEQVFVEYEDVVDEVARHALDVLRVGDEHSGFGITDPVANPLVAVENRERQQDGAVLPSAEKERRRLGRGGSADRNPILALDAMGSEDVGGAVGEGTLLAPSDLALVAAEILEDHGEFGVRMLVADVRSDVVAVGNDPTVLLASLLVGPLCDALHLPARYSDLRSRGGFERSLSVRPLPATFQDRSLRRLTGPPTVVRRRSVQFCASSVSSIVRS